MTGDLLAAVAAYAEECRARYRLDPHPVVTLRERDRDDPHFPDVIAAGYDIKWCPTPDLDDE